MKVKIGNKVYNTEDEPIMIVLSDKDKENISNMGELTKYCGYPKDMDENIIVQFMDIKDEQ